MSKSKFAWLLGLAMATVGGSACANAQSAQSTPPPVAASDPAEIVATVGDKKFSLKDVEAKWQADDPAERARVTQLLYQHRRQSIDQLIGDYFIEQEIGRAHV